MDNNEDSITKKQAGGDSKNTEEKTDKKDNNENSQQLPTLDTPSFSRYSGTAKAVMIANTFAAALAEKLSVNEQIMIGSFLELLGSNLLTIAALDQIYIERINRTPEQGFPF